MDGNRRIEIKKQLQKEHFSIDTNKLNFMIEIEFNSIEFIQSIVRKCRFRIKKNYEDKNAY